MKNKGKYYEYISPFSLVLDLLAINVIAHFILPKHTSSLWFHLFITFFWTLIAWNIGFYQVFINNKFIKIIEKLVTQYLIFMTLNFAYIGFFLKFSPTYLVVWYITIGLFTVAVLKFFTHYLFGKYSNTFIMNNRRVVILGNGKISEQLINLFNDNPNYGYKLEGVFDLKTNKAKQIKECYELVLKTEIDEIYSSLSDVDDQEINDLIDFADKNLKTLKFIPDNKQPLIRNLVYSYCGPIPVLSLRNIPLHRRSNKIVKRIFDIIFSLLIIVFVLSWLTPILALLIKLESKGKVFFTQKRHGLNYKEFTCYKFRSMRSNDITEEQACKKDPRITRIGAFIRKTSMDELPQFFNVLIGNMSVVGPRPHPLSHGEQFNKKINKFMIRHFIKPGITGLAQTNGYRGEIETDNDIINRVRYDIFYLENWSFILDLKIILKTIYIAIKGDKKAY